jgi:hypothetical protein
MGASLQEGVLRCDRALYKEITVLGKGSFSKVTRVRSRLDGTEYAVKRSLRPFQDDVQKRLWVQARSVRDGGLHEEALRACGVVAASEWHLRADVAVTVASSIRRLRGGSAIKISNGGQEAACLGFRA